MVLLVTDGKSNRGGHLTIPRAQALKRSGVKIFVVAVGEKVRGIDETDRVASYPPKDYLFRVKNSTDSCKLLWFKGIPLGNTPL